MSRSALFVEREDVLIAADWRQPTEVRLLDGVAGEVRRLSRADVAVVVVADRWRLVGGRDEAAFATSQARLVELLAAQDAQLAGAWHARDEREAKPRPTLLLAAAKALGVDLSRSWLVGVSHDDAVAAAQAGCAGAVLLGGPAQEDLGIVVAQARSLADAPRVMVPRDGGCWHG